MRVFVLVVRLVCLVIAVWGVYGFGGRTLVEILKYEFGCSLRGSAAIVSILVAVLATASLIPARSSRKW